MRCMPYRRPPTPGGPVSRTNVKQITAGCPGTRHDGHTAGVELAVACVPATARECVDDAPHRGLVPWQPPGDPPVRAHLHGRGHRKCVSTQPGAPALD